MTENDKLRYETALATARTVFANENDATGWLQDKSIALGGVTPLSLLTSEQGLQLVLYELEQMRYGHPT